MTLIPGTLLGGSYRIVDVLGFGGQTASLGDEGCRNDKDEPSVYRAHDTRLGRQVALKVLRTSCLGHDLCRRRFEREGRVQSRLEHPNVVPFFELGSAGGVPWMAMRLVEGGTLAMLERRTGRLQPHDAVHVVRGIAVALDHVHAKGVLHGNVTPHNILVEGDLSNEPQRVRTYLADLCSCRVLPGGRTDGSSDIYSLAVVAYEMLTGRPPFVGDSPSEVLHQIVSDDAPPPSRWNPSLPPVYDLVFARSLSRNPAERHASAGAFALALTEGLTTRLH